VKMFQQITISLVLAIALITQVRLVTRSALQSSRKLLLTDWH